MRRPESMWTRWFLYAAMAGLAVSAPTVRADSGPARDPRNLALTARASSSEAAGPERWREGPQCVNDGDHESAWTPQPESSSQVSLDLTWEGPGTIRQVLIWRNLRKDLKRLTLQAGFRGTWTTLQTVGNGTDPLPKLVLIEVPARRADAIRLTGFVGTPSLCEVEVYDHGGTPVINLAGDAAGRILGVVTDAFGTAPLPGLPVVLTGRAGGKPWKAEASSDTHGMFEVAAPAGLTGRLRAAARYGKASIVEDVESADLPLRLTPPDSAAAAVDLNGTWKFAPDPPAGFFRPGFDDSEWKPIEVPSHWVLAGFNPARSEGGYRRRVGIPEAWNGRRIKIRFEGVYSGAEVWFNGKRAGGHEGGFTPFEVDVTEAAHRGENLLALRVSGRTRSSDLDAMSLYADFDLGGVIRKVSLFAVPVVHVERLHVATKFDRDFRDAVLRVDLKLINEGPAPQRGEVRCDLVSPGGASAPVSIAPLSFSLPGWSRLEKTLEISVPAPEHWEAEHPKLYRLRANLVQGESVLERVERRVGFRQVEVRGTELLVNGVPVKLRGTCHHDSDPVRGRAVTPDLTRRDLEIMKEANIDALRTSHYPAIEDLFDGADELGLYVEAEAPFCWVSQAYDLRLAPLFVQHTAELLERDRSHPSVIIWSLANESEWGPGFDRAFDYVKRSDPTRPTSSGGSNILDLATRHNPISLKRMKENEALDRPLIWDESLCVFQGIWRDGRELRRDPGERDYWIAPLVPIWQKVRASKIVQGSMIWAWSDDNFQVPGRGLEHGRYPANAHVIETVYGVPGKGLVGDAPWGVVDGWRRRKPEFWHTKKLYSPVRVTTLAVPAPEPGGTLRLEVENRYEFTNLSELTLRWEMGPDSGELHPDVPPGKAGGVEIPVMPAAPGRLLVRFLDDAGRLVDEESVLVGAEETPSTPPVRSAPLQLRSERMLAGNYTAVLGEGFELAFDKDNGGIRRVLAGGRMILLDTPTLHWLSTDAGEGEEPFLWSWEPTGPLTVVKDHDDVVVTSPGKYRNASGRLIFRVTPQGHLDITYDFKYLGPAARFREIGMRFTVPSSIDTLFWKRRGEWTTYPEDHIGRNEGRARAHSGAPAIVPPPHAFSQDDSPFGSNDFRSTKRNIERASITDPHGFGFAIESNGEQHLRAAVEAEGIAVCVNDWFGGTAGVMNEWLANYGAGRELKPGDILRGTIRLRILTGEEGTSSSYR
jgi:beta-galactosidase